MPRPQKVLYFLYQNGEFYAFPVIFIDTVLFKKGHPNQKGGCPDTLDPPGSARAAGSDAVVVAVCVADVGRTLAWRLLLNTVRHD